MNKKLLFITMAALLPQVALADFCSLLKRGNTAQAAECRKTAAANNVEIQGNWSIMGVNGQDPKTGQRGVWRTASTPPAGGKWSVQGYLGRIFYLNANCFLGQRSFSVGEGADAASHAANNVWITFDDGDRIMETWTRSDTDLAAPNNTALSQGIATARRVTIEMPGYSYTGKVVNTNRFVYELDGYTQAAATLCR